MKKYLLLTVLIMAILGSNVIVSASVSRSLPDDYFNKVFDVSLNSGESFFETYSDERKDLNLRIYRDEQKDKCSLYDRFGPNVKFIPYFGETKIQTTLVDRFYTSIVEDENEFILSWDLIKQILKSKATSNNMIYETRANVLGSSELEDGCVDPRVACYSGSNIRGGNASIGNLFLFISSEFTQFTAWISSSKLFKMISDLFDSALNGGLSEILTTLTSFLLPVIMSIGIFLLCKNTFKSLKGNLSFRSYILGILGCMISLGFIIAISKDPKAFNVITCNAIQIVDNIFDDCLNVTVEENEVVSSDNVENVREAYLWYKAVFNPWCEGMFQTKYENLYTMFDKKEKHVKLEQSSDNVLETWEEESGPRYNSMQLTGDVVVPLGTRKVRNWAALAYSCQSVYHIDATEDDKDATAAIHPDESVLNGDEWPKASHCPYNDSIFIDNFRWIDAKLDISPQYYSATNIVMNYDKSRNYKETFVISGLKSLWMAIMLIPLLKMALRRFKYLMFLIAGGIRFWWSSMMSFVIPDRYDVISNFKRLVNPLSEYLWWSLLMFISISLYGTVTGKLAILDFLYIAINVYFFYLRPKKVSYAFTRAKQAVKDAIRRK